MSSKVTHAYEGDLVVFHIGMTLRKPHRVDLWGPVFLGMGRMLTELQQNRDACERGEDVPDLGFLGAQANLRARGLWMVQYWRDTDSLYAYSQAADHLHLPAWRAFNQASRKHPDAVGIWHETYAVPASGIETFYGNGAVEGLGRITGTVPVARRGQRARERLGGSRMS